MDSDPRAVWVGAFTFLSGLFAIAVGESFAFRFLGVGLAAYGARRLFDWWRARRIE